MNEAPDFFPDWSPIRFGRFPEKGFVIIDCPARLRINF